MIAEDAKGFQFFCIIASRVGIDILNVCKEKFAKVFKFTVTDYEDVTVLLLYCTSNSKAGMKSIKSVKKAIVDSNRLLRWDRVFIGCLQTDSRIGFEFLQKFCTHRMDIVVDGAVSVTSNWNYFEAMEFCFLWDIESATELQYLFTKLIKGEGDSPVKTKIPPGVLKGQLENAKALFEQANPLATLKSVVQAAQMRRIGKFQKRARLDWLPQLFVEHGFCCLANLVADSRESVRDGLVGEVEGDRRGKHAIKSWLEYHYIDPYFFALQVITAINNPTKKNRNILLFGPPDTGKSYFWNTLKNYVRKCGYPVGTFAADVGRFKFMFCMREEALFSIGDDIPVSGFYELLCNQGLLDGENDGFIDRKYANAKQGSISPLFLASNITPEKIEEERLETLLKRIECHHIFGEKEVVGGANMFGCLCDWMSNAGDEKERECQLASFFLQVFRLIGIEKLWKPLESNPEETLWDLQRRQKKIMYLRHSREYLPLLQPLKIYMKENVLSEFYTFKIQSRIGTEKQFELLTETIQFGE